ncbi:cache domain-containing protein, partial [Luteimonas sp. M1R5S18]
MSSFLSRLGISRKLGLLTALGILALLTVIALQLTAEHRMLMAEKETATRGQVQSAVTLAGHFHARAERGELSEEQARDGAMAAIKALRYGNDDYFWINDMQPRMLMHPFKPEMDGTDLTGFADPNGVHLFVEAVARVKAGGAGFIHYAWPKPGADQPVPKISYVQEFAPWGWVIGSGIYVDDVQAALWASARAALAKLAVVLALLLAASWVISRSITQPIARAVEASTALARGRLDGQIQVQGRDETARLLQSLQGIQQVLQRISGAQREMHAAHEAGDIDHRIDAARFEGAFGEMADQVNELVAAHIDTKMRLVALVREYAEGDLSRDMDRLPRGKAVLTETMDATKSTLLAINAEIQRLSEAAAAGDFSQRGDADRFRFAYRDMIVSLNRLMASADRGLSEVGTLLSAVAAGDLTREADASLPGQFGRLAEDANGTVRKLADVVGQIRSGSDAINAAASEIASGNSDLSRRTEQ